MFEDYIHAVTDAERRIDRLTRQIEALLPDWSLAPIVGAIQPMRGIALINAVTVVAEVGDFARFGNPISAWCQASTRVAPGCGAAVLPRPVMLMPGGR